jgi:hypothetical protein
MIREMHIRFWSENLKGRIPLGDLGADGRIILEWIVVEYGGKVRNGFMRLMVGTSGGLL